MWNAIKSRMGRWSRLWLAAMLALTMALAGCGAIVSTLDPSAAGTDPAQQQPSEAESPSGKAEPSSNGGSSPKAEPSPNADSSPKAPLIGFKEVSDYLRKHGKLPDNFITKKEAEKLGWVPSKGNLHQVAPGKSIGGDRFGNREKLLPDAKNRIWYEADANYKGGTRGADRIVYSNDGLIYMTTDHYKTFQDITKEGSVRE